MRPRRSARRDAAPRPLQRGQAPRPVPSAGGPALRRSRALPRASGRPCSSACSPACSWPASPCPLVGGVGLTAKASADEFLALPTDLDDAAARDPQPGPRRRRQRARHVLPGQPRRPPPAVDPHDDPAGRHRDRGQPLLRAPRRRLQGHRCARRSPTPGRPGHAGRLDADPAVRQERAARGGAHRRARSRPREEQSFDRKLREARYALALEQQLSKDEILDRYLDIAYYGNGVYGIGTAADALLRQARRDLTLAESALLAGVVQNPTRFNRPATPRPSRGCWPAATTVLARMRDLGYIDDAAAGRGGRDAAADLQARRRRPAAARRRASPAPFFCDYVRHELEDTPVGAALGDTPRGAAGPAVRRRPDHQDLARPDGAGRRPGRGRRAGPARRPVRRGDRRRRRRARHRQDQGDGGQPRLRRASPGRPRSTSPTGGGSGFQAGSTFKTFTLAAALQKGLPLSPSIHSPATYYLDRVRPRPRRTG